MNTDTPSDITPLTTDSNSTAPMANVPSPPDSPRKPILLRILITTGKVLGALFLFFIITVIALYYALHTEWGADMARLQIIRLVDRFSPDIKVDMKKLALNLPQEIAIEDVQLHDREGMFFTGKKLFVRLDAKTLFRSLTQSKVDLMLPEVLLAEGHLHRIPLLSPSQETATEDPPQALSLLPSWLTIQAPDLTIQQFTMEKALDEKRLQAHLKGALSLASDAAQTQLAFALAFPEQKHILPENIAALRPTAFPALWPFAAKSQSASAQIAKASDLVPPQPTEIILKNTPAAQHLQGTLQAQLHNNRLGLALNMADNALLPMLTPDLRACNLNMLAEISLPVFPLQKDQPLHAQWQGTAHLYAPILPASGRQLQTNGVASWDGERLALPALYLSSPATSATKKDDIHLIAAGGFAPEGTGMALSGNIKELTSLFAILGMQETLPEGSAALQAYIAQGKDWWQAQLDGTAPLTQQLNSLIRQNQNHHLFSLPQTSLRVHVTGETSPLRLGKETIGPSTLFLLAAGNGKNPLYPQLPERFEGELKAATDALPSFGKATIDALWKGSFDGKLLHLNLPQLHASLPGLSLNTKLDMKHSLTSDQLPLLDGEGSFEILDWSKVEPLLPVAIQGKNVAANFQLQQQNNRQNVTLDIRAKEIRYQENTLSNIVLNAQGKDIYALLNTLSASSQPNTSSGSLMTQLQLEESLTAGIRWKNLNAKSNTEGTDTRFEAQGKGDINLNIAGIFRLPTNTLELDTLRVEHVAGKTGLTLTQKATLQLNPDDFILQSFACSLSPKGSARLAGNFSPQKMSFDAAIENFPLRTLEPFLQTRIPASELSLTAALSGTPQNPSGNMALSLITLPDTSLHAPLQQIFPNGIKIRGTLKNTGSQYHILEITNDGTAISTSSLKNTDTTPSNDTKTVTTQAASFQEKLNLDARIPLRFDPTPGLVMDAPVNATVQWQGHLANLWRLVPLPGRKVTGYGQVAASVSGTLEKYRLQTEAFISQGSFVDTLQGIALYDINLEARYSPEGKSIVRLNAGDKRGGSMGFNGSIHSTNSDNPLDMSALEIDAKGELNKMRPLHREDLEITLSGTTSVKGRLQDPQIAGNILINKGSYTIMNLFAKQAPQLENVQQASSFAQWKKERRKQQQQAKATPNQGIGKLNVSVTAPGKFFVRGKGLESEWRTDLRISGTATRPLISGTLSPVRGSFAFMGRNFEVNRGDVSFQGIYPPNPVLNLALDYKGKQITAAMLIKGTASNPQFDLTSQPPLPRDEVMAQILFDKSSNSLSRFQLLQAANAARQLTDSGPSSFDIMGGARNLLGLETLSLGSSDQKGVKKNAPRDASLRSTETTDNEQVPTLEMGKYVLDNVYVGVEQGLKGDLDTSVRVDIDVLSNVSVTGKTSSSSSNVGINWKMDY